MKPYIYSIFFVLILGLGACTKKELPEPINEQPLLTLSGMINGSPFDVRAGEKNSNANTISYIIDTSSLRTFYFRINAYDSQNNPTYSYLIYINNYSNRFGDLDSDVTNTIIPRSFDYTYSNFVPFYSFKPYDVNIVLIDHKKGYNYYSMPSYNRKPVGKFDITAVRDVYENGRHYRVADIEFNCYVSCIETNNEYYISNGRGTIAFGGK